MPAAQKDLDLVTFFDRDPGRFRAPTFNEVIDQDRVTEDGRSGIVSCPNREDDPQYIVRLVGQVVRVSVETVKFVTGLPAAFA